MEASSRVQMVCGTDTVFACLGGSPLAVSYPTISWGMRPAPGGPLTCAVCAGGSETIHVLALACR